MRKNHSMILPLLQRILSEVGENIRLARLRRRFSASIVAERSGMTRTTLRSIERGDPHVTFGAYARVLLTLGLEKDLSLLARDDELGRKLQDAGLPVKARAPRKKKIIDEAKRKIVDKTKRKIVDKTKSKIIDKDEKST